MSVSVEYWLERLEGIRESGTGYTALCPAHDDHENSLAFSESADGDGSVVHCFAGCSYKEILTATQRTGSLSKRVSRSGGVGGCREWWEAYTGLPSTFWVSLGVRFHRDHLAFTWDGTSVEKLRASEGKKFWWEPSEVPAPPLWPKVDPSKLNSHIWLTEGESDCGVLRYLGLPAFALTKGAGSSAQLELSLKAFKISGVKQVVLVPDLDSAGGTLQTQISKMVRALGLSMRVADVSPLVNPFLGEKDLRDAWLRSKDKKKLLEALETGGREIVRRRPLIRVGIQDLLRRPQEGSRWLVQSTVQERTVGMFVGAPKVGKSWLALDLGLSIATGLPFLNEFEVDSPGAVVHVSKEDPPYSLQDRLEKILVAKGLGGRVRARGTDRLQVRFPPKINYGFYLDLSRRFSFTDRHVDEMIQWLLEIRHETGKVNLVVFDPILRMMGEADEFKVTDVNEAVFDPAIRIVDEVGCSVLMVHHMPKGSKTSYGSIGFHAFSDFSLYVMNSEPDDEGLFHVRGEFKSAPETHWSYLLQDLDQTYRVQVSREDYQSVPDQSPEDVILAALQKYPDGRTLSQLDRALSKLSVLQVKLILSGMTRSQKIVKENDIWKAN